MWGEIALAIASLASGAMGADAAKKGAAQASRGNRLAIDEQRRQYDTNLKLLEPSLVFGNQAMRDLGGAYGWTVPEYRNPLATAWQNASGGVGPITVEGRGGSSVYEKAFSPSAVFSGFGGGAGTRYGATIDPLAGTVDVSGGRNRLDEEFTAWLRGEGPEPTGGAGKYRRIKNAIGDLRGQGYTWDAATGRPVGVDAPAATTAPAAAAPSADPLAKFYTSPEYKLGFLENLPGVENTAAARGGLFSGDTARSFAGNAGNAWEAYASKLFKAAGFGETAAGTAAVTGSNTSNNVSSLLSDIGNARASGTVGASNAWGNALNSGIQNLLLLSFLKNGNDTTRLGG